jgi:hypothetical protein
MADEWEQMGGGDGGDGDGGDGDGDGDGAALAARSTRSDGRDLRGAAEPSDGGGSGGITSLRGTSSVALSTPGHGIEF